MDRPTLSDFLNLPDLPESLGQCATSRTQVVGRVNRAQYELLTDPLAPDEGWWFGWVEMLFNLTVTSATAYLRTPNDIARLIVLDICNRPRFIRNGFYEYLQFGFGHRPRTCNQMLCDTQQVFDRPSVPTLVPFPSSAPQTIRIYPTDNTDVGRRVVIQGPDQNGNDVIGVDPVTGGPMLGETIPLGFPFVQASNQYQDITGLIKDPTNGPVKFFTVDASGNQTQLSSMEPNETTASYRQYLFTGLPVTCCNNPQGTTIQVKAQAKLDFVPAKADTDYLIIPNVYALLEQCMSIKYSAQDSQASPNLEAKHHKKAIAMLNGQLDLYEGKTRTAIGVPIFGSNVLRPSFR